MTPQQLGPYVLRRQLARGGMGEVWEAVPEGGGAPVALKWLLDGASRGRFLEEVRHGQRVSHPHLVRVLDAGVDQGYPWLAMELLDGATLAELRRRVVDPWPEGLVLELARQLLEALEALHTAGVVHRDIKPSNIFLTREGTLRVIDLGIATAQDSDRTQTSTGSMTGSLRYAAPEQAKAEPTDGRSDLYSAGLVLFELLAGRRVYDQPTDAAVVSAMMFQQAPRLLEVHPAARLELDAALTEALSREKEGRPASARAFHQRLEAAGGRRWEREDVRAWLERVLQAPDPSPTATGVRAPLPAPLPAPKKTGRRRRALLGVLLAGAVGGVAGLWRLRSKEQARSQQAPRAVAPPAAASLSLEQPSPKASAPEEEAAVAAAVPSTRSAGTRPKAHGPKLDAWLTVSVAGGWGQVWLDGRRLGETPLYRRPVAAGERQVVLISADGKREVRRVTVKSGQEARVIFR